jgi:hypothetical protein
LTHDMNPTVGMAESTLTTRNTESLAMKAWLEK